MKGFIKSVLAIAVVLAIAFGLVKGFEYYNSKKADGDTSYKVKTKRNKKYNGVYTLTKLDENGKNTWNGLIMYVKNDKIISANLAEFESRENIINNKLNGKKNASDEEILKNTSLVSDNGNSGNNNSGFGVSGQYRILTQKGAAVGKGQIVFYDRDVDINKDYDNLKRCKVVAGYDEDSKEIWLSKLLKNNQSEYSEGYKLIHYKNRTDLYNNCGIESGICMLILNDEFNAGLDEN